MSAIELEMDMVVFQPVPFDVDAMSYFLMSWFNTRQDGQTPATGFEVPGLEMVGVQVASTWQQQLAERSKKARWYRDAHCSLVRRIFFQPSVRFVFDVDLPRDRDQNCS